MAKFARFLPIMMAFVAFVPQPALAKKAAWDVVAVKSADGRFGFCRAETKDTQTGLTLAVALSPTGEVNLGIKVPDGGFTKGETFPLTVTVEGTAFTKKITAEAGLPDLLLMRMGDDPTLLAALAKGSTLSAKGDADETRFALTGGAEMTETLKSCVADGKSGKLNDKTGGDKPAAGGPAAGAPVAKNGLPSGLASLLSAAKLDVTVLNSDAPKSATAVDESWTVNVNGATLDGGFREMRVKKDQDFNSLIKITLDALKGQCKAGLKVEGGKAEALAQATLASYDLTCGKEFVALVAYRTATDIYGQLMHRVDVAHKDAAITARDRLAAVIRQLGQAKPTDQQAKPATQ